ncbi:hypothetical protein ACIBAI_16725 [Streptomyces sp. NPDC051041]|uniref:hypothetical protein n=1 Tax=Streptomyces sp. NPDC051041 TaxID=3365640 RepID=UPI0037ABA935
MLAVAVLLLPGLGLLLFVMTRIEDRLLRDGGAPRSPHRGHLRLLPGGRSAPAREAAVSGRRAQRGRHAA